jgi:hypothetical protein
MRLFQCCVKCCVVVGAVVVSSVGPLTAQDVPTHDRDPWIFRCVLDDNPRMLVMSLGHRLWLAFDTQRCVVHKVWQGDVALSGAVYDGRHGPQPQAVGTILLGRAPQSTASVRYRGYRLDKGVATLLYDLDGQPVAETVVARLGEAGRPVVSRQFVFDADKSASHRLQFATSAHVMSVKRVDASQSVELSFKSDEGVVVEAGAPGSLHIEMTFAKPE